jgi:GTPase SAR1 family protein
MCVKDYHKLTQLGSLMIKKGNISRVFPGILHGLYFFPFFIIRMKVCKTIVIGDVAVGKTSLVNR